jgi:pilus assembly protein CpaB
VSPRRTLIIIVAIVIAAVAAVANVLYLNSVQDRANKHAKLLRVFVVARDIPKGTTGETAISGGLVKSGDIPEQFRPATALTDINQVRGKVALTSLASGQVIVDGQFVEPVAAQVTFSQRIPAGQVAVSMAVDALHAVDNLLVPGDKVDMIVPCSPTKPAPGPAGSIGPTGVETFFWQNVTILAIGSAAAPTPGQTQAVTNPGSGVMTFALPPISAERLLLAQTICVPTLALVPPDNQPTPIPTVDPGNFWGQGLTPYSQP